MRIKSRTAAVIFFSSITIVSVLSLTLFGFYTYLEWKEKNINRIYKLELYELHAKVFEKYIVVYLKTKMKKGDRGQKIPLVEGTIRNNSNKTIYSLKLKIIFSDQIGRVLYAQTLYPIGIEFESLINISDITNETKNFLLEGDSVSFQYTLKNSPVALRNFVEAKSKFLISEYKDALKLSYKIEGIDIR